MQNEMVASNFQPSSLPAGVAATESKLTAEVYFRSSASCNMPVAVQLEASLSLRDF